MLKNSVSQSKINSLNNSYMSDGPALALPDAGRGFIDKLKEKLFFNLKCLKSDAKPNDFFKEIAHSINLEGTHLFSLKTILLELYKVIDINVIDSSAGKCPILLEITNESLRE